MVTGKVDKRGTYLVDLRNEESGHLKLGEVAPLESELRACRAPDKALRHQVRNIRGADESRYVRRRG